MRARKVVPFAVTVVALAAVGVARAETTTYRDGPLTATLQAGTHHPTCKQIWPVTVTARYHGKPAHATAFYQFLLLPSGHVVGKVNVFRATKRNPHNRLWHFYGRFRDNTFGPFGALAVGNTLRVRVVVRDGRYTAYPWYTVEVKKVRGCPAR